jgi:putative PEP-CTERM system TPR-repeat lipoprotein
MFRTRSTVFIVLALLAVVGCGRDPKTYVAKGDQYVAAKKYREATIEYRNALQSDPRLGEVRMKLADAYAELGDLANAIRECQRGADLLPADMGAQLKAGQLLLMAGRYDEAKTRARKVLDKNPKNVEAQVLYANSMAGVKDLDGAIRELEQAIALDPKRSLSYANLGGLLYTRGNRDQAETAYRNAVAMDAKSVAARLALANFLWSTDRPADAEASLKDALAIDPANILAHRALATLYLGANRAAEAEPHLKAAADASKGSGLRIVLADYYLSQKRIDDALRVLQEVSKQPDGFAAGQTRIAAIYFEAGRKSEAYTAIDSVLAKLPKDPAALMTKGRFLLDDGKRAEALAKVKASIEADPGYAPAQYLLGLLSLPADPAGAIKAFNEVVKYSPRAVPAYLELARLQLAQGNAGAAVDRAGEAVRYEPNNYAAHELFARALVANNELDRAAQEAQLLQAAAPERAAGPILAALVAVSRNDPAGATKLFEKALAADPKSLEALQGLVQLDLASGKPARAKGRVQTALSRDPKNSQIHLLDAAVASAENDAAGIERSLRQAAENDPAALDAYLGLGRLYVSQNKLADAQQEFEAVAAKQPKSVAAHTFVAMALQVQGKVPDAQKRYEQVLAIDPRAPVAANNLAMIYLEQGTNLDTALQLAQTAKSGLPDRPEINDTLGWIYYKKGLASMAVGPLLQAADKAPKDATIQFHAGMALAKAGNKPEARQKLEAALALDAKFAGADEARQTLASLK